jgi:hypothetical protein
LDAQGIKAISRPDKLVAAYDSLIQARQFIGSRKLPEYYIFDRGQTFGDDRYMIVTSFNRVSKPIQKGPSIVIRGGTRRKRSTSKSNTRSRTSKRRSRSNSTA